MICISGNRPILKIGTHQVIGYDMEWLETALSRASIAANRHDHPCLDLICTGVTTFLEQKCSLRALSIEDLYARIHLMLQYLECGAISDELRFLAPPLTISLASTARRVTPCFELGFFRLLREELEELHRLGSEVVHFIDIEETVCLLTGSEDWTEDSVRLQDEIQDFLVMIEHGHATPESQLSLTLEECDLPILVEVA